MQPLPHTLAVVLTALPFLLGGVYSRAQEGANLVRNATFEEDADGDGVPDGWSTSGRGDIIQKLSLVEGRAGGKAVRLECTEYVAGTPDAHAMVCQVGAIAVKRGTWYKLSFWARGLEIQRSLCEARLSKTKPWGASGIDARFAVTPAWKHVERICQATDDVPTEHSRLQFWYHSTGTLWLDDVVQPERAGAVVPELQAAVLRRHVVGSLTDSLDVFPGGGDSKAGVDA